MGYSVVFIQEFEADYDAILGYLSVQSGSPQAAIALMDSFDAAVELLADNPLINAVSLKPQLAAHECRAHHVGSYVIVYTVRDEMVVFVGMFHQRQLFEGIVARRG